MNKNKKILAAMAAIFPGTVWSAGLPVAELEEIVVVGETHELVGVSDSATQGTVFSEQLQMRPVARPAELLEMMPGLIATQHSGEGKANQYFLRGFNLDHGTDFYITVDGLPVNMRTHGHGQGYADLNFLIPELVNQLEYRKGPYYADIGDFSAAGSADFEYVTKVDKTRLQLTSGADDFYRGFFATSPQWSNSNGLIALDYQQYRGPWEVGQDLRKLNALAKYSRGDDLSGFSVTAMAYEGDWTSPDQIPQRAVLSGQISDLGFIDPTVGGESHRYSLSTELRGKRGESHWNVSAYWIDYFLDLYSNFTYFLEDPINGDQFKQLDDRQVFGGQAHYHMPIEFGDRVAGLQVGVDVRHDDIGRVGLFNTRDRVVLSTVRDDEVQQTSIGLFGSVNIKWNDKFRSVLGLRLDHYRFDVDSNLAVNSGNENDTIVAPKLSLVFGPWAETEYFVNVGKGFHSNDARGTTITVDPTDPTVPVDSVDPLVDAWGVDLGIRSARIPNVQLAAALWGLRLDSELVFVGDGGATEASGASERYGLELSAVYTPKPWLIIDADYSYANARFRNSPGENRIPLALDDMASLGVTLDGESKWHGSFRLRHFGEAALIEDNSQRSEPSTVVNAQLGYDVTPNVTLTLSGFNLFDSNDNDITYFYDSRLAGEAAGVGDIHFHPLEPRTVRLTLRSEF